VLTCHVHQQAVSDIRRQVDDVRAKYDTVEARLLGMVESRLGGYTDVYAGMPRFVGCLPAAALYAYVQHWSNDLRGCCSDSGTRSRTGAFHVSVGEALASELRHARAC
jgi:hypothetical protein